MGNPKQKWTAEEEKALIEGIAKHGRGKWKLILADPQFAIHFINRTNIDLKDKCRNMDAQAQGSGTRSRTPKPKLTPDTPVAPSPLVKIQTPPVVPVSREPQINHVKEEPVKDTPDAKNCLRYNNDMTIMILEALSEAKEQNWMDISSIVSYIEQRIKIEAPQQYRKQLRGRLKTLVHQGRVEKGAINCYRLNNSSLLEPNTNSGKNLLPRQPLMPEYLKQMASVDQSAKTAAYKVAEAEEKTYLAAVSARKAERLSKMQEETESMFYLAQEMYDRCHGNDILLAS